MYTIEDMKNEIKELRGSEVKIFGQKTTLSDYIEEELNELLMIDIIDVMDNLEKHEIVLSTFDYNEETDEEFVVSFDSVDDYIDFKIEKGDIDKSKSKSDNSYNWNAPLTNDFNIAVHHDMSTGGVLMEFRVHRYGDVRSNYTNKVLLEFDDEYEYIEVFSECDNAFDFEVEGKTCTAVIDPLSEYIRVYGVNDSWDREYSVYDLDELKEEVKKDIE